jgi:glycosyltransferase involved in cell wall biosynthesis
VEAVLRARLDGLTRWGIEAHAWFLEDLGGRPVFAGKEDTVGVGGPATCLERLVGGGFDLICSIDTEEILTGLAGWRARGRLVIECHSSYLEGLDYLRRLAPVRPDAIFTPSDHQRRMVRRLVGGNPVVRVLPNPLRQAFVEDATAPKAVLPRPVVAWIGRLDDLKNWQGFLELAGILRRRGADLEFWLAGRPGDPGVPASLLERAGREGVLDCLKWWCGFPHERMPTLLDMVRDSGGVVVSTSRAESFGMTLAEAMARACAVVAPDRPPATEFVEDGRTGGLYAPDVAAAADRVQALLGDRDLRESCGRRARGAVLARFAPEPALAVLASELRAVVAGRPGGDRGDGSPRP